MMMVGWLDYYGIPFVVVLTKADKLPRSKMPSYVKAARSVFAPFKHCKDVVPFSSITGLGKSEVLAIISQHLA
jgi:GTP-binding protein